ncbi:MAG TPA: hypothetical protein VM260_25105 [Pirellula sp.]|nr:hypothetical protein [Pirellula sp.]
MRKFFQFNFGFVLSVTFLIAICFVKYISLWIILLLAQLLLIRVLAALLFRGIPNALLKVSRDNCYRMNGIKSPRREARERKARTKIRSDLFAVLIIVALSGDWLILMLDILVIPLPVATELGYIGMVFI